MTEHCCVHMRCIDQQEATSLRYRLTCLTRERFEGKNGTSSGSDLENMRLALDRFGAHQDQELYVQFDAAATMAKYVAERRILTCDLHRTCTRCLAEAQEAKT